MNETVNCGRVIAKALKDKGIENIFTLSGGHIFSIYDGCVKESIGILDTRHEQSAVFAAEAAGKLTRKAHVSVLTAGPGVTNGISAITSSHLSGTPLVVLAGRAPESRWGSGSLQEIDHIPIVKSITKLAETIFDSNKVCRTLENAFHIAELPHKGPVFLDFPLEVAFSNSVYEKVSDIPHEILKPGEEEILKSVSLIESCQRPVVVAGSDLWNNFGENILRKFVRHFGFPTFLNGMSRGILSYDDPLFFSHYRQALKLADLVIVIGAPLDFRLSFGRFKEAKVIHFVDNMTSAAKHLSDIITVAGDFKLSLDAVITSAKKATGNHGDWVAKLRVNEQQLRASKDTVFSSKAVHPIELYRELNNAVSKDAIIIGDGGDFVSFAGKYVQSYEPGCFLDPGPYGCLGTGLGYLIGTRSAFKDRQIVLAMGDGAFGFCGLDIDTLVRHNLGGLIIVGNNGIWGRNS
jgi:acetolactate synthase-1/2/3 large subunit